ncbi:MAG: 6-pyruvoyl tetrahydrobiopterin synthase [Crocinitomicaceae bacterium]|nr:6-pyruvoyl tetrahydrobiopterin synthase [Crocinitomicaceae bacterium]|tara:strand:- start:14555 stop:14965 length:411 start_codon:yes stop_codon:yes gene_type:complete
MRVTVKRKAHFNAAHRLYRKDWSDAKNEAIFGLCSNPHYHGHNYDFWVEVTGEIDPETGYVIDMKVLKDNVNAQVCNYMDHKNLNEQVEEFSDLNPTAEHIAFVIWTRLHKVLDKDFDLRITLFETERNCVVYSGE